jgi:glycosyltransferase involved in cell wall biosynthesis
VQRGLTFAVVGHNEAERLHVAVQQARAAAGPRDEVWFVDSASTDDSCARAAALGARVVPAPRGKGRALAAALAQCPTE